MHAISERDTSRLVEAADLACSTTGTTQPHPNAACILLAPDGTPVAAAAQRAQGAPPAEVLACAAAAGAARGGTAFLNLECGDCHGDDAAVTALLAAGVARVVVGLRHPLPHLRGCATQQLSAGGVQVDVLPVGHAAACGAGTAAVPRHIAAAAAACAAANDALLHRAALRMPLSVLKYAMTLDGKIATNSGHAAWVSSPESRARVFQARAASDAVIVGGNTVRRDNPRLTTRCLGGHQPVRIVMSRTLDLPEDANLWDVGAAPTIVMTQRGARAAFQARLRSRGVDVVEFDFLSPAEVARYCYERGFLRVLWECGGTLAAPAIQAGVVHQVLAFVAPKIIGGARAPTPVGDLGFVEMTQAVALAEAQWSPVGPDMLVSGYLPASGGPLALAERLAFPGRKPHDLPSAGAASAPLACAPDASPAPPPEPEQRTVSFYKAWDEWGALSNFSPHPIRMAPAAHTDCPAAVPAMAGQPHEEWASVEHFYQAAKFGGMPGEEAAALLEGIRAAGSPEEAAALGRRAERDRPHLLRPDWTAGDAKVHAMRAALLAKFTQHSAPAALLDATGDAVLVEGSPHDTYWGSGFHGGGRNQLGRLLMQLRAELRRRKLASLQHLDRHPWTSSPDAVQHGTDREVLAA